MHPNLFESLERKYAQHASWAIWNSKDPEDTTVIRENLEDLKTSVVMVALNISRALSGQWQNFHSRDHARKLMYAFNQSPYRGAYMTDLIKGYVEPRSAQLRKQLSDGRLRLSSHLETFGNEMNDLGANNRTLFILFGGEVTKLFNTYLAGKYPNHVGCPHYSMYGKGYTDAEWVEKAWSILEHRRATATACDAGKFLVTTRMRADLAKLPTKTLCRSCI